MHRLDPGRLLHGGVALLCFIQLLATPWAAHRVAGGRLDLLIVCIVMGTVWFGGLALLLWRAGGGRLLDPSWYRRSRPDDSAAQPPT